MKKVIITGATSMIGLSTLESCLDHDVEKIYAVVRPNSTNLNRLPDDKRITIVECDANEYGKLQSLITERCDVFYHFAWRATGAKRNENIEEQINNIQFTVDAVKAANTCGCTKFIGAGSQAEYGRLDIDKIGVDSLINPTQPYGIAKYAAGKLAKEKADFLGIDCVWVRIFSIYGKYDKPSTLVSSTIAKMKTEGRIPFTQGVQRWDYLYSKDAGEAFYAIGDKSNGSKVYCLGSGVARPLKEYILIMKNLINQNVELGFGDIPYGKYPVMNLCADISDLQNDTGWTPRISFKDGILEIIRGGVKLFKFYLIDASYSGGICYA